MKGWKRQPPQKGFYISPFLLEGLSVDISAYSGKSGSKPQRHSGEKIWNGWNVGLTKKRLFLYFWMRFHSCYTANTYQSFLCLRRGFSFTDRGVFLLALSVSVLSGDTHTALITGNWMPPGFYTSWIFNNNPVGSVSNHMWIRGRLSLWFTAGNNRASN